MSFDLAELGWDAAWAAAYATVHGDGLVPARVAIEYNHIFRVFAEQGELNAQISGRVRHRADGRQGLSAVGDWVAVRPVPGESNAGTIEAVLPRRSRFSRKVAGDTTEEQIVASNIDTVFLVMGLDGDYNPRRLERYLLLAQESGARPIVLLSKSDLPDAQPNAVADIQLLAPGVPVHAVSARQNSGLEAVERYMGPGRTAALLGSSGAGKSTLINALAGDEKLKTQEVRASDSRGRHTTRHRQLILLPGRGLLIDTPGMREIQLWDVTHSLEDTFDDVEALAAGCHFTDCRHRDEPRCAVKAAVADGRIDASRLVSYLKLQDEQVTLDARKDVRAQLAEKRQTKVQQKALKALNDSRSRDR